MGPPSILRFKPRYNPTDMAIVPSLASLWRTPSVEFDPDMLAIVQAHGPTAIVESLHRGQVILEAKLEAWKSQLKSGIKKVGKIFCHKANEMKMTMPERPTLPEAPTVLEIPAKVPSDRLLELPPPSYDKLASTTEDLDSTNTIPIHPAATTRSLSHVEALDPTTTYIVTFSSFSFRAQPSFAQDVRSHSYPQLMSRMGISTLSRPSQTCRASSSPRRTS